MTEADSAPGRPLPEAARTCLDCGAPSPGNFCPQCGQETAAPELRPAAWLRTSSSGVPGREGRLRRTMSQLLFAPGSLTLEYLAGRRARYLRPLQVYLTASLIVFAAVQFLGLGLSLRFVGDAGIYLLRSAPPDSAQAQRNVAIQLVIDHVDVPAVRHFAALSVPERFAFMRARRALAVSYFILCLVPAFAWAVGLAYRDRRRPYGEHLVFALHGQALLLLALGVGAMLPAALANALSLAVLAYLGAALRRVHGGTWSATLARGALVVGAYFGAFFAANLLLTLGLIVL